VSIVIPVLLGVIFLPIIVLCLPVAFSGKVHMVEKVMGEGEVVWAWGLVAARLDVREGKTNFSLRLGPLNIRPRRREEQNEIKKTRKPRHPGQRGKNKRNGPRAVSRWKSIAGFLDNRLIGKAFSFLRRLIRSLNLKFRLEGEYGTGDPALTGYVAGLLAALNSGRGEWSPRPNFTEAILDLRGEFRGRVIPAGLLWHTGGFFLAAPVRRLWWSGIVKPKLNPRRILENVKRKH